jgi:hypothetical protein
MADIECLHLQLDSVSPSDSAKILSPRAGYTARPSLRPVCAVKFHIQDEKADGDLSEAWNDAAVERLLAVAPGTVGIGTVRNVDVPVTISVLARESVLDANKFDQVVECSIAVESGTIVAAGCTDYFPDAVRIKLPAVSYRIRASFEGLDAVSANGLVGSDHYHLQLWPAPLGPVQVRKRRG